MHEIRDTKNCRVLFMRSVNNASLSAVQSLEDRHKINCISSTETVSEALVS